ncbi:MAG: hypothetical protein HYY86_01850 [Candidatus Harrisonbacteria bacterium]|nr:hypothetical protein [Candidatus Harrisonbacteria bacterium]
MRVLLYLMGGAVLLFFIVCLFSVEVGGTPRPAEIRLVTGERVMCSGGIGPVNFFAPGAEEYLSCRSNQWREKMPWATKNKEISWNTIAEIRFINKQ